MIIRATVYIQPNAMILADLMGFPSFLEWAKDISNRTVESMQTAIDAANEAGKQIYTHELEAVVSAVLTSKESEVVTLSARFVTSTQMEINVDTKESTQGWNSEKGGWTVH